MRRFRFVLFGFIFLLSVYSVYADCTTNPSDPECLKQQLQENPQNVDWTAHGPQAWEAVLGLDSFNFDSLPSDAFASMPADAINDPKLKSDVIRDRWGEISSEAKSAITSEKLANVVSSHAGFTNLFGVSESQLIDFEDVPVEKMSQALNTAFNAEFKLEYGALKSDGQNLIVIDAQGAEKKVPLILASDFDTEIEIDKDGKIAIVTKKANSIRMRTCEGKPCGEPSLSVVSDDVAMDLSQLTNDQLSQMGFTYSVLAAQEGGVAQKLLLPNGEEIYVFPGSSLTFTGEHFVVEPNTEARIGFSSNEKDSIRIYDGNGPVLIVTSDSKLPDRANYVSVTSSPLKRFEFGGKAFSVDYFDQLVGQNGETISIKFGDSLVSKVSLVFDDQNRRVLNVLGGGDFYIADAKIDTQGRFMIPQAKTGLVFPSFVNLATQLPTQEYHFVDGMLLKYLPDGRIEKLYGESMDPASYASILERYQRGTKIRARQTVYSLGLDVGGLDNTQDNYTNAGFGTNGGAYLTPGVVAVHPNNPFGLKKGDIILDENGYAYVVADVYDEKDEHLDKIDVYMSSDESQGRYDRSQDGQKTFSKVGSVSQSKLNGATAGDIRAIISEYGVVPPGESAAETLVRLGKVSEVAALYPGVRQDKIDQSEIENKILLSAASAQDTTRSISVISPSVRGSNLRPPLSVGSTDPSIKLVDASTLAQYQKFASEPALAATPLGQYYNQKYSQYMSDNILSSPEQAELRAIGVFVRDAHNGVGYVSSSVPSTISYSDQEWREARVGLDACRTSTNCIVQTAHSVRNYFAPLQTDSQYNAQTGTNVFGNSNTLFTYLENTHGVQRQSVEVATLTPSDFLEVTGGKDWAYYQVGNSGHVGVIYVHSGELYFTDSNTVSTSSRIGKSSIGTRAVNSLSYGAGNIIVLP
jgi:hypothetical protein